MADKTRNFSLKRIIANDKSLILFSFLLAVIIWIAASLNVNSNVTKVITKNVPIAISSEYAEQNNLAYYSLKDSVDVNITISGEKYVVGQVSSDQIDVRFDTHGVTGTGKQSVKLLVTNNSNLDFTINSYDVNDVDVFIDTPATEVFGFSDLSIPITAAEGYFVGDVVLSDYEVSVHGPKTYVDNISGVDIEIPPKDELTESYAGDCEVKVRGLIDADKNYLRITSSSDADKSLNTVYVTVPILKETTLPVTVNFDNAQKVTADAFTITCDPAEMTAGVLEGAKVTEIVAGNIPIDEICPSPGDVTPFVFKTSFPINKIEGVTLKNKYKDDEQVKVTVTLKDEYEVTTIPVSISSIAFENVPETVDVTKLTDNNKDFKTVWIVAPTKKIEGSTAKTVNPPTADDLKLTCDLSAPNDDGAYPVKIVVNNDYAWAGGKYNVILN